jgi:hypothetical protein
MSNETPQVFEVTAIESFPVVEGKKTKEPKVHIWKQDRIGTDKASLKFQIEHELADGKKGTEIAAFSKRLEVKVDSVNF